MAEQDDDFAKMFPESERDAPRSKKRPRVGDPITGKVISIGKDTVFVDLGGKAEGSLERAQVSDPEGKLLVNVAGVRVFCPASQLDVRFIDDLATYIGQRLTFRITRYEPRNLVLSRRVLLEEDNARRAAETRKKLEPGAVLRGKVVGFKPFGAFVDLGGIEGMRSEEHT